MYLPTYFFFYIPASSCMLVLKLKYGKIFKHIQSRENGYNEPIVFINQH